MGILVLGRRCPHRESVRGQMAQSCARTTWCGLATLRSCIPLIASKRHRPNAEPSECTLSLGSSSSTGEAIIEPSLLCRGSTMASSEFTAQLSPRETAHSHCMYPIHRSRCSIILFFQCLPLCTLYPLSSILYEHSSSSEHTCVLGTPGRGPLLQDNVPFTLEILGCQFEMFG